MQDSIPCPICRGEFATMHLLMVEMSNSKDGKLKSKTSLQAKQVGLDCSNCNISPIVGKAYKCNSCSHFYLCGTCFNTSIHDQHDFEFRQVLSKLSDMLSFNKNVALQWKMVKCSQFQRNARVIDQWVTE